MQKLILEISEYVSRWKMLRVAREAFRLKLRVVGEPALAEKKKRDKVFRKTDLKTSKPVPVGLIA